MPKVVHIRADHNGNHIASKLWHLINEEISAGNYHESEVDSVEINQKTNSENQLSDNQYVSVYYDEDADGKRFARAIFVDFELDVDSGTSSGTGSCNDISCKRVEPVSADLLSKQLEAKTEDCKKVDIVRCDDMIKTNVTSNTTTTNTCITTGTCGSNVDYFQIPGSGMKDVPAWLKSLRLHKYTHLFSTWSYEKMMSITEEELASLGVVQGARHKIVGSIAKLRNRAANLVALERTLREEGVKCLKSALDEIKAQLAAPIKPSPSVIGKSDSIGNINSLLSSSCNDKNGCNINNNNNEDEMINSHDLNGFNSNVYSSSFVDRSWPVNDAVELVPFRNSINFDSAFLNLYYDNEIANVRNEFFNCDRSTISNNNSNTCPPLKESSYLSLNEVKDNREIDDYEGDYEVPTLICRILRRICILILSCNKVEEECFRMYIAIAERYTAHEAFTETQQKELLGWKQQIETKCKVLFGNRRKQSQNRHSKPQWQQQQQQQRSVTGSSYGSGITQFQHLTGPQLSGGLQLNTNQSSVRQASQAMQQQQMSNRERSQCLNSTVNLSNAFRKPKKPLVNLMKTPSNYDVFGSSSTVYKSDCSSLNFGDFPLSNEASQLTPQQSFSNKESDQIKNYIESLCLRMTESALGF